MPASKSSKGHVSGTKSAEKSMPKSDTTTGKSPAKSDIPSGKKGSKA